MQKISNHNMKFGRITRVEVPGAYVADIIRFDKEGNDHVHKQWEYAALMSGQGRIIIDGVSYDAPPNKLFQIPPGVAHRMKPTGAHPSCWVVWYSDTN